MTLIQFQFDLLSNKIKSIQFNSNSVYQNTKLQKLILNSMPIPVLQSEINAFQLDLIPIWFSYSESHFNSISV